MSRFSRYSSGARVRALEDVAQDGGAGGRVGERAVEGGGVHALAPL
jgi:hypothetical protein